MPFAAVHWSLLAQSGHSLHRNSLSAFGPKRTTVEFGPRDLSANDPITITAPNHEITFTIHSSIICNTLFRPYVVLTAPFRVKICFFAAFRIFISFRRFDSDFRFCRRNRSRFNSFSDNSVMAVSPQLTTF